MLTIQCLLATNMAASALVTKDYILDAHEKYPIITICHTVVSTLAEQAYNKKLLYLDSFENWLYKYTLFFL